MVRILTLILGVSFCFLSQTAAESQVSQNHLIMDSTLFAFRIVASEFILTHEEFRSATDETEFSQLIASGSPKK